MKSQVLIVFDSLRWDVFKRAKTPFLDSLGEWRKAYTQGTYTLPAHMSFFAGKLPQTFDRADYYDCIAARFNRTRGMQRYGQLWRLDNPESPRTAKETFKGQNIVEGFRQKKYLTVGTGAVNWFNPELPAAKCLTDSFEKFRFFGGPDQSNLYSSEQQIDWSVQQVRKGTQPFFMFINFGETHHRFIYNGCAWQKDQTNPYGDRKKCLMRQKMCLEYLDGIVSRLFSELSDFSLVMCSDHGEVLGENGLWGHGFYHKKVMEVPLLIKP